MEMPWRALRGSGAFPAGLGGFLSAPAGGERGKHRAGRAWSDLEHGDSPKSSLGCVPTVTGTALVALTGGPEQSQLCKEHIPKNP